MTNDTAFFTPKKHVKLISPQFIYAKLLCLNSLIYTAAFILGYFVFHSLKVNEGQIISERINAYFSVNFTECQSVYEFIDLLLDISSNDISHLLIIFTAGFTMLSGVIISALHAIRGFSLGFTISYLAFAEKSHLPSSNVSNIIIVYSVLCATITALFIHFGVKTSCFSDEFKSLGGRPRLIIKSKAVYLQFMRFFIAFGAILILNSIRSVL